METNEAKEHISLLNIKLMHSIDVLVDAYDKGYELFKEKKPDEGDDTYYAAVISGFVDGVLKSFERDGKVSAAISAPIVVAAALIKYLSKHPELKADLMF